MEQAHKVKWVDAGREPKCPPNPAYPKGIDIDEARGAPTSCSVALPYPAKRIGHYKVTCRSCGRTVVVTTAGRPDDPRSLKMACADRVGGSSN